ncbi:MAG: DUF3298 domain-containing protein [Lachnospiraceae bacterium]|nr:DUF3298 domain-containing protein [Lachnospiraceae bacterium]
MKKKALTLLAAAGLILSMTACQQKTAAPAPEETETKEPAVTETEEPVSETEEETESEPEEPTEILETESEKKEMEVSTIGFVAPDMGYRIENHAIEEYDEDDTDVLLYTADWDTVTITKDGYDDLKEALAVMNANNEETLLHSEMLNQLDSDYEERKEGWIPYDLSTRLSVVRFDDKIFSVKTTGFSFLGGAHGSTYLGGVTFDSQTGRRLELNDLLLDPAATKEFSSKYIKDYVNKVYNSDGMGTFEGWEAEVDHFLESPVWILNDYGLEYMIDAYILGPYAMGNVEVTIPYSHMKGLMKDEYLRDGSSFTYQFSFGEEVTVDDSGNTLSAIYKTDPDSALGTLTLQFGEEAIIAAQNIDVVSNPWVVKEADGRIYVVTETGLYSEDMAYTHMLFQLTNGSFLKLDEIDERAVTNAAEVEAIVEGLT